MKNNQKLIITLFLELFLCFTSISSTWAQPLGKMSRLIQKSMNNYIIYGNELTHSVNLMHEDFNYLNLYFKDYLEKKTEKKPQIGKLQSVMHGKYAHPIPLEEMYERLRYDNVYISKDKREDLFQLASQSRQVVLELEDLYNKLHYYANADNFGVNDTLLSEGFKMLKRVEVLFYDLSQLQEKIHYNITALANRYQRTNINEAAVVILQRFNIVIEHCKDINRLTKIGSFSNQAYTIHIQALKSILEDLEKEANTLLLNIPLAEDSEFCTHVFYKKFLADAQEFLKTATEFPFSKEYENLPYPPAYYLYNFELFPKFNRYGDGLTIVFNKLIDQTMEYYVKGIEYPLYYKLLFPVIPAYDSMLLDKDSVNIDSLFAAVKRKEAETESKKIDSLAKSNNTPQIGVRNMEGFATNNLVFLLDVSVSMNSPEKLPLLKNALFNLLDVMREEDNITIITYSGQAQVILDKTSASNREAIENAIQNIKYSTLTDADKGIKLAYDTAKKNFIKGGNNRIVLATDGKFKLAKATDKLITSNAKKDLSMSIFYFSAVENKETKTLLTTLASKANGRYQYVQPDNANLVFLMEVQTLRQ